jgi:uncharacterized membrane protein YdjX (TVP38/TMEM64 family)
LKSALRFSLLLILLTSAVIVVRATPIGRELTAERITATLDAVRAKPWAPALLIGLYTVIAPLGLPISPLLIGGAVLFGPWWGGLWNLCGMYLGSIASFIVGRRLGRDFVARILGERRVARMDRLLERHAFWTLVRIRFFPIPFPLVNFGAALVGVELPIFAATTAIGMTPASWIYTYFWATLAHTAEGQRSALLVHLTTALALILLITLLPAWWMKRRERRSGPDNASHRAPAPGSD